MMNISFIFTEKGFYPDLNDTMPQEAKDEGQAWKDDPDRMLYELGAGPKPQELTASARFLYLVSSTFFKKLTALPELEIARDRAKVFLDRDTMMKLLESMPFSLGSENISEAWLKDIFRRLQKVFSAEIKEYDGSVQMYLAEKNQDLHVPERVFFHLVEQEDDMYPFAFMATYATKVDKKISHFPLQYALTEYKTDRSKLIALLSSINKAADVSPIIAEFMSTGELFHPLRLTAQEAFSFLNDIEKIEAVGILCRIPNWWRSKSMNPNLVFKIGDDQPSLLGFDSILSMKPVLEIDGVPLTKSEIQDLLNQTEGLAMIKGKWIHVDHARLRAILDKMDEEMEGISFMNALKKQLQTDEEADADNGYTIQNGAWLTEMLNSLRNPSKIKKAKVPSSVHADLRPYQKVGFDWLSYMNNLGFGACLADDMGLGKTLQVLTFLESLRNSKKNAKVLLVVPASLLGNWQSERDKFVPGMDICVLHSLTKTQVATRLQEPHFLYITTYGMALRLEKLQESQWDCVILDEAQAIKNPLAKQTRAIKKIPAMQRIALTGTPIENDLGNLWSLFDFLNKGLLGSSQDFSEYCRKLENNPEQYARLRSMISPFLLRRMKTDKKIIKDLPDKIEMLRYTELSKKQTLLYRKYVEDMEKKIKDLNGMERRGTILAALTHLKQICNHPDQYLGVDNYKTDESGKFEMLKEICETIYEKRERVLVFTQFKEIIPHLAICLEEVFHAKGRVIHGGVSVKQRQHIVEEFQSKEYIPFIVCSLKAAGTGLNLTNACHVIHFDRWWNPAVENQATDRAFRIGQKKNVMVYKFVNRGTIEEKIDLLINSKKELAENVIGAGSETWLTEMSNEELLNLLKLE